MTGRVNPDLLIRQNGHRIPTDAIAGFLFFIFWAEQIDFTQSKHANMQEFRIIT